MKEGEEVKTEGEEKAEKKMVKKTRTVKKERVKKDFEARPFGASIAELQRQRGGINSDEVAAAADALDEWLRRDTAQKLIKHLREKRKEELAKKAEREKEAEERAEKKRKRDEQIDEVKKAKKEKKDELRGTWKEADEGMTDDEKKGILKERNEEMAKLNEEERAEIKELVAKLNKEAEEEAPKADTEGKPRTRTVTTYVPAQMALFEAFDPQRVGCISPEYLAKCLLATGDGMTLKQANDLATLGGTWTRNHIMYKYWCTEVTEEEIPEEPKKEEAGDETGES